MKARQKRVGWLATLTPDERTEAATYLIRRTAKRQANLAARTLSMALGVPHIVVTHTDAAGNKTFQPVRADQLNVDSSQ